MKLKTRSRGLATLQEFADYLSEQEDFATWVLCQKANEIVIYADPRGKPSKQLGKLQRKLWGARPVGLQIAVRVVRYPWHLYIRKVWLSLFGRVPKELQGYERVIWGCNGGPDDFLTPHDPLANSTYHY